MFILDTDHISVLQWEEHPATSLLVTRMEKFDRDRFYVTIVSFHE